MIPEIVNKARKAGVLSGACMSSGLILVSGFHPLLCVVITVIVFRVLDLIIAKWSNCDKTQ